MTQAIDQDKLVYLLERTEIVDLVRAERFARDQRDWDGLVGSYVPGAPVRTTWFDGTIEEFAEASRLKMETKGSTAKHWIFPFAPRINGDRALSEAPATIFDRILLDGVEFDVFQYCRFFSRVVRTGAGWRLASFEGIYQRDHYMLLNPEEKLPVDWELVKTLRPSYKFLAYNQISKGYDVNPELLGDDRPDLLETFYARENEWLEMGA